MEFTILDKSNYLKGLFIVAKKDNQLAESEKNIIRGIGEKLGFASDFYEEILRSLLANKYINDDPIKFSDVKIAKSFVSDGLNLAFSDNVITEVEIGWLKQTAAVNEIEEEWFEEKISKYKNSSPFILNAEYALYSIL